MENTLYVIRDNVADTFGPLYEAKNDAVAIRQFKNLLERQVNKEDFELYKVGKYDNEKGEVSALSKIQVYSGEKWIKDQNKNKLIEVENAK